jgi:hypothetical protein
MERRFPAAQAVDEQFHALQDLSRDQFAAEREQLDAERGRPWQRVATFFASVGRSH